MDNRNKILAEAYLQLSNKGIQATKIDDIAKALKMSKKTIYLLFRSKEELVIQTAVWKLQTVSSKTQIVVEMNLPVIEKIIQYLEVIYTNMEDVSLKMIGNFLSKNTKVGDMMEDYLQDAVFGRFAKLFDQAKKEGKLKENAEPNSTLMMYWETLSTFLFARPIKSFPKALDTDIPINQLLGNQMINLFRGFLNEVGIKEFDSIMKRHPVLSGVFG